jgi:hypothetical protein
VPVALIVVLALVVAAVGAGAVILSHGSGSHQSRADGSAVTSGGSDTSPSTNAARASGPTAAAPSDTGPGSATTSAATSKAAQTAILGLLGSYQTSYSSHDSAGLSRLFAATVVRHGLAAGGCRVSHGRSAVLASYESQFAAGSGAYRLDGLTSSQIRLSGPDLAHLSSRYEITPGGTGSVGFTFVLEDNEWKISLIDATCA